MMSDEKPQPFELMFPYGEWVISLWVLPSTNLINLNKHYFPSKHFMEHLSPVKGQGGRQSSRSRGTANV